MNRAIEVSGDIYNIVEDNGVFKHSRIQSVWVTIGDTFVADDDIEVSCDGKIFNVSKGDIVSVFRRGKGDAEVITFRNDTIANYIKTQLEERNKHNEEAGCSCDCESIGC